MNKTIAILGGTGQLGNSLNNYLSSNFNITIFSSKSFPFPNINIEDKLSKYDIIINCVGFPYRNLTINNSLLTNKSRILNYEFVVYIVDYCKKTNKKLIHISSNSVYYSKKIYCHKEDEDNKVLIIPYDKHKLDADLYVQHNLQNYLILRPYNVHGDPMPNKEFFNTLTNIIENAKEYMIIVKNLTSQFVSGNLIGKAIIFLLCKNVNGVYNISTKWIYRDQLMKLFLRIINQKVAIKIVLPSFFNIKSISHGLISTEKIEDLGFTIPSIYDNLKDWWDNELSTENKNNIIKSINKIEKYCENKEP